MGWPTYVLICHLSRPTVLTGSPPPHQPPLKPFLFRATTDVVVVAVGANYAVVVAVVVVVIVVVGVVFYFFG